ncbi:hypothetical protein BJ170DRAFT_679894 [Xylariales sp. AK1849]|nr:hypothetical protein BJ170DRAFT_679894 [Xylariales sp. AK1849]
MSAQPPEFHFFPLLPPELRLKVYRLALPSRTVPIRLKMDMAGWNGASETDWWTHYGLIADGEPGPPLPGVLFASWESFNELQRCYGRVGIDAEIVAGTLEDRHLQEAHMVSEVDLRGGGAGRDNNDNPPKLDSGERAPSSSLGRICTLHHPRLRAPRLNPRIDVLRWSNPQRWASSCPVHQYPNQLFLAACLSSGIRYMAFEYIPALGPFLEALALSVMDERRALRCLDLRVKNPSCGRLLRFRLCRIDGERTGRRGNRRYLLDDGQAKTSVEHAVKVYGNVFFPWFDKEEAEELGKGLQDPAPLVRKAIGAYYKDMPLRSLLLPEDAPPRYDTAHLAIMQVLSPADPTTFPGASGTAMRRRMLKDPVHAKLQYQQSDEALEFGQSMQTDVLLWCHGLRLHGAGYPCNMPFKIVGIPCHGFCGEEFGMGG